MPSSGTRLVGGSSGVDLGVQWPAESVRKKISDPDAKLKARLASSDYLTLRGGGGEFGGGGSVGISRGCLNSNWGSRNHRF